MAKQDQNDTPSNLSRTSGEFRDREVARNEYQNGDPYTSGHENALSDGDEKGKGDTGTIGSSTDISKRNSSITKNKYGLNNPYSINNA